MHCKTLPQLLSLLEDWNIILEETLLEIEKLKKNEWKILLYVQITIL